MNGNEEINRIQELISSNNIEDVELGLSLAKIVRMSARDCYNYLYSQQDYNIIRNIRWKYFNFHESIGPTWK